MRQHLRDIWKPGISVLGVALAIVGLVLAGPRAMFLALATLFAVWLGIELFTFPSWPRKRLGRDVLFATLGAGTASCLLLGIAWNTLDAPSHVSRESAATRAATSEVLNELFEDGAILKEVGRRGTSSLDAYEVLKTEAFARQRHVLAGVLPFQKYQLIQRFYSQASYPPSWVLGREAGRHIDELAGTARSAQVAIFPYVDLGQ
jgi:hypothetical protein